MTKFDIGDHFYVLDSGLTGRIVGRTYDYDTGFAENYMVSWDYMSRQSDVPVAEGDQLWEHIEVSKRKQYLDRQIPGSDGLPRGANFGDIKGPECLHDWKNYQGLKEFYDYCTKCDAKRQVRNQVNG